MRKVDLLRELQDQDLQLDGARVSLTQARQELGNRVALDRRAAEVDLARQALHRIEAQQRDLELRADTHRAKIAADEKRLYSGMVGNPKELAALSNEVAQDKRQRDGVEDQLLELLEQSDQITAELAELASALARETAAWNARQEYVSGRVQELEGMIGAGVDGRAALAAQLDPPTQFQYDQLRRQKQGTAVAQVLQRTCQGCRVSLTAAIEQRARAGQDIVTCQSCGRILYVSLG